MDDEMNARRKKGTIPKTPLEKSLIKTGVIKDFPQTRIIPIEEIAKAAKERNLVKKERKRLKREKRLESYGVEREMFGEKSRRFGEE